MNIDPRIQAGIANLLRHIESGSIRIADLGPEATARACCAGLSSLSHEDAAFEPREDATFAETAAMAAKRHEASIRAKERALCVAELRAMAKADAEAGYNSAVTLHEAANKLEKGK